jgi:hypothetical protein
MQIASCLCAKQALVIVVAYYFYLHACTPAHLLLKPTTHGPALSSSKSDLACSLILHIIALHHRQELPRAPPEAASKSRPALSEAQQLSHLFEPARPITAWLLHLAPSHALCAAPAPAAAVAVAVGSLGGRRCLPHTVLQLYPQERICRLSPPICPTTWATRIHPSAIAAHA